MVCVQLGFLSRTDNSRCAVPINVITNPWRAFVLLLPMLEMTFDVVSPIKLMELTHPSNVLLKRLQVEAPGTYHHSMMVSTLAEAAAEQIRANSLLVRGGAYYHDIGKLKRPQYFIENQIEGENIHDTLSPPLSALVILSHVQEGINLAKEYGLPGVMIDFISEHHGTTCLSYFYNKAKKVGMKLIRHSIAILVLNRARGRQPC